MLATMLIAKLQHKLTRCALRIQRKRIVQHPDRAIRRPRRYADRPPIAHLKPRHSVQAQRAPLVVQVHRLRERHQRPGGRHLEGGNVQPLHRIAEQPALIEPSAAVVGRRKCGAQHLLQFGAQNVLGNRPAGVRRMRMQLRQQFAAIVPRRVVGEVAVDLLGAEAELIGGGNGGDLGDIAAMVPDVNWQRNYI